MVVTGFPSSLERTAFVYIPRCFQEPGKSSRLLSCVLASLCLPTCSMWKMDIFFISTSCMMYSKGGCHCSVLLFLTFCVTCYLIIYKACGRHRWAFVFFPTVLYGPLLLGRVFDAGWVEASRHFAEYNLHVFFLTGVITYRLFRPRVFSSRTQ
ncbi:hypothetical protein VTN77DRAFT_5999 [Rasamsonia byssochlamydoides]|uniref:uncharacterized protein n=1 Tax=Rasamsonia byssochlamydoides TaxID=89139 RepID=UPI0037449992